MVVYIVVNHSYEIDNIWSSREKAQARADYLMQLFPREKWLVHSDEVQHA